ncbi:MAG: phosphoglycerate kinase [Deltaproteobacteria bacterium]|nr:phosphoglycerate kinase [Deltaproteobacteria bacterium]
MKSIRDLNLEDRAVFMRLDLNVPIKDGKIKSDARIRAALPTIKHALEQGAKVALASHLGRPKKKSKEDSLEPVGVRLSELLDQEVTFADDCIGDGVKKLVRDMRPGKVVLLENLRFHAAEEKNDPGFAKELAAPYSVYINDAFGSSHRAHASIVGMVKLIEERAAGFLMEAEVKALSRLLEAPAKPFVAVIGGAKVADKVGVLNALLTRVDAICIGGAMAYTFMKARGDDVGASKVEADKAYVAKEILERAASRNVALLLPEDHVVGDRFDENTKVATLGQKNIPAGKLGLDIGPKTRDQFVARLATARTVFWNGPMGVFEWKSCAAGTMGIARALAESSAFTVVGGGDSVAALEAAGVVDKIGHVSTGGGASLELLELGTLPGIEALRGRFAEK